MFKPNSQQDRLNYGDVLTPPTGYTLDAAVGTTYSLDLETLTAVAITLGLRAETDSEIGSNPIGMLNALQKISDKIIIFSEAGQIKMPDTPSALCLFLEKMIVPVALKEQLSGDGADETELFASFHPKTWTLKYSNQEGKVLYRFVVLSRNLTFDRSWDVSAYLDGEKMSERQEKSMPVVHFLEFLKHKIMPNDPTASGKKGILQMLIREIEKVQFSVGDDKRFTDFEIQPLGIGKDGHNMNTDPLFTNTFHDLVVVSPFLTGSVIERFNRAGRGLTGVERALITRRSSLKHLKQENASNFEIYVLKDTIVDGEESVSDEAAESQQQDIHAKIYLRRKGSYTDLYMGSMNATWAAMNKNVECMLKLTAWNRYLNKTYFLADLFGGPDEKLNPFEQVEIPEKEEEAEADVRDALEQKIKVLCRMNGKASVTQHHSPGGSGNEEKCNLQITFDTKHWRIPEGIKISPLRSNKTAVVSETVTFEALDVIQVSEFFTVTAEEGDVTVRRVIFIPTMGLPADREKAVVQSIVKDKKSFIEYVAYILEDDYLLTMLENNHLQKNGAGHASGDVSPALYEKMLRTALDNKDRLKEIDYLLQKIDDKEIVSDEFRRMYETFKTTLRLNGR